MRGVAAVFALLAIDACKDVGLGSFDTGGYATPSGLSHLDSKSPSAAEDKWLKSYYGGNHGWGWDTGKTSDPNCGFYNTCESKSATGW